MTVYEAVVSRLAMLGYTVTDNDETGLNFLIDKCEKDILADINQRVLPDGLFYDGMEKACRRKGKRTTVYYCHPHAPHERGSNENMNRIIRRFFPKGTNFDEVPISEIRRAEEWMNNYPREVLGWQTAATLLRSYMSAC